ncbi:TetR/AcrR family transcriptional regulator [Phytomonospora endophytica]|uniref:AcrR family transcriptional regulator n=1 Tax=Phytomonospora endophytica TaxID=714109 RepID=A0A841FSC4_9ACTN|nr:TetR/AcrR family transcriptional regulator [Phytomonospora endophytica]MBB6038946.1 AcrR family transcriptional regulator [Phytomonospora endophytica]GIG67952.1 TetR family transcriptional regulator [Phytomonospora endophytica]
MTEQSPGLRELRKRETRQAISDIATRLFLARGFERVTIAEVAAAARVAKMTVTNYFPRKEDLVFDMQEAFTEGLATAVRDRAPGESAIAALRRDFHARLAAHDPVIGFTGREFGQMVAGSPALSARLREFHDLRENALAEALAAETGAGEHDLGPRVAASQLAGVLRVLFGEVKRRTLLGEEPPVIAETVGRLADAAFVLAEVGLGDYLVRSA